MDKKLRTAALSFSAAAAMVLSTSGIYAEPAIHNVKTSVSTEKTTLTTLTSAECAKYETVHPLDLTKNPRKYLNKKIKLTALFDKFTSIGLDYEPVNRSSKDYISFMIKRPDIIGKNYTIPLSELKLILPRDKAEKLIDLESGDKIELFGTVFSTTLNDPWVDVDEIKILTPKEKPEKNTKK